MDLFGRTLSIALAANAFLILTSLLSGCGHSGPELGAVTGKVTRENGQPIAGVMVEFQPKEPGSPSIGYTDESGYYQLRYSRDLWGALVGSHVVRINYDSDGREGAQPGLRIPPPYHQQSVLTADVHTGKNQVDFQLSGVPSVATAQR